MISQEDRAMRQGDLRWMAVLMICAFIPGCLLNSVHSITAAPRTQPDSAHAIVVIGVGLEAEWPFSEFPLVLDEYSAEKKGITGSCFHYNRIEVARRPGIAKITYLAYEVPANIYVYSGRNANATLAPSSMGRAFMAPPGATVYFGDYIFVGNGTVEFRRNIEAARSGAQPVLPHGAVLESAEPIAVTNAPALLCTP
jgi:hypothetical protein